MHTIGTLRMEPLRPDQLDLAVDFCARCVGPGLYSRAELSRALESENEHFFLHYDGDAVIGYYYILTLKARELSRYDDLSPELAAPFAGPEDVVGISRSAGIDPKYRKSGLSDWTLNFCTRWFFDEFGAKVIFAPLWKQGDYLPGWRVVHNCHYDYLTTLSRPWHHRAELHCFVCGQPRCVCDAEIYYLRKERYDAQRELWQADPQAVH